MCTHTNTHTHRFQAFSVHKSHSSKRLVILLSKAPWLHPIIPHQTQTLYLRKGKIKTTAAAIWVWGGFFPCWQILSKRYGQLSAYKQARATSTQVRYLHHLCTLSLRLEYLTFGDHHTLQLVTGKLRGTMPQNSSGSNQCTLWLDLVTC
jgi:hypothetical protein